jgi:hypothetical protein
MIVSLSASWRNTLPEPPHDDCPTNRWLSGRRDRADDLRARVLDVVERFREQSFVACVQKG